MQPSCFHMHANDSLCYEATCSPFFATLWAAKLLESLVLGVLTPTKPSEAGGKPSCFFVKRPVCQKATSVLMAVGYSIASTPSMATYAHVVAQAEDPPLRAAPVVWAGYPFSSEAPCK